MSDDSSTTQAVLIATLDILGITQLMQQGKPEELNVIAAKIKTAFINAMTCVDRAMREILVASKTPRALQESILVHIFNASVKFHDFSDTIVISCDTTKIDVDAIFQKLVTDADLDSSVKMFSDAAVHFFGLQVLHSFNALFREGFPVRGCVDAGAVYMSEKLVVGSPYIKSLHCGEALDFSGVVITDKALEFCKEHERGAINGEVFNVIDLCVPLKTKGGTVEYSRQKCLNWLIPNGPYAIKQFDENHDWKQLLYEKFAANGKSMTESALRKLVNTENTIRAFIMQNKAVKNHAKTPAT